MTAATLAQEPNPPNGYCPSSTLTVRLWSDAFLGTVSGPAECVQPEKGDNILRLTNVSDPTISLFRPAKPAVGGPAVLVCPGGGYGILAMTHEGEEVAQWLNSIGVTAFVLKYRVPNMRDLAFQDAQRAVRVIRHRAGEWGVDTARLGIIGFSAGAHLAARLCTNFETSAHVPIDAADQMSCRPDFAMLMYPAYLVDQENRLQPEITVTATTPRTILIQTQDDSIRVENSLFYYHHLKKAGVPSELHVYPAGGHGYGLRPSTHEVCKWPNVCAAWMRKLGVIE